MKKNFQLFIFIFLISEIYQLNCQPNGEAVPGIKPDTTFIFTSPRSLINIPPSKRYFENGIGLNMNISGNGFGMGMFYKRSLSKDLQAAISLLLSGARNTDEIEYYYSDGSIRVPNKINRLYMFPLTLGLEQSVFSSSLNENFKPYVEGGIGAALIVSTPYDREFFNALHYARGYTKFAGFIGFGANFSSKPNAIFGIDLRYYYIPFGGNGLESIIGLPIYDFGGLFISFHVGNKF